MFLPLDLPEIRTRSRVRRAGCRARWGENAQRPEIPSQKLKISGALCSILPFWMCVQPRLLHVQDAGTVPFTLQTRPHTCPRLYLWDSGSLEALCLLTPTRSSNLVFNRRLLPRQICFAPSCPGPRAGPPPSRPEPSPDPPPQISSRITRVSFTAELH